MPDLDTAAEARGTGDQYMAEATGVRRCWKERVGNGLSRLKDEG
jgi:hypothetical protein